jgi:hypothetical protein
VSCRDYQGGVQLRILIVLCEGSHSWAPRSRRLDEEDDDDDAGKRGAPVHGDFRGGGLSFAS